MRDCPDSTRYPEAETDQMMIDSSLSIAMNEIHLNPHYENASVTHSTFQLDSPPNAFSPLTFFNFPDRITNLLINIPIYSFDSCKLKLDVITREIIKCGNCNQLLIGGVNIFERNSLLLWREALEKLQAINAIPLGFYIWDFDPNINFTCTGCDRVINVSTNYLTFHIKHFKCENCKTILKISICKFIIYKNMPRVFCVICYEVFQNKGYKKDEVIDVEIFAAW